MAEAVVRGAVASGFLRPEQVLAADVSEDRRAVFQAMGTRTTAEAAEAVACETVLLAVKPQALAGVQGLRPGPLYVSIMAGVTLATLGEAGCGNRVVRVMPNTPLMIRQGMSALAAGVGCDADDWERAERLFSGSGRTIWVGEPALDAVTAVSGSGPAYLFYLAEAMEAAARAEGFDTPTARLLVSQTLRGAAELLAQGTATPTELRERVTSPNGTTHAAIQTFEAEGVGPGLRAGVAAAATRSRELGGP